MSMLFVSLTEDRYPVIHPVIIPDSFLADKTNICLITLSVRLPGVQPGHLPDR
jgi:hypothetical protein